MICFPVRLPFQLLVITSYSIHYTKLYEIGDSYNGGVYSVEAESLSGAEELLKVYSENTITTKDAVQVSKDGNVYTYKVTFDNSGKKYSVVITSYSIHYTKLYDAAAIQL